jgi:hypothetical protein
VCGSLIAPGHGHARVRLSVLIVRPLSPWPRSAAIVVPPARRSARPLGTPDLPVLGPPPAHSPWYRVVREPHRGRRPTAGPRRAAGGDPPAAARRRSRPRIVSPVAWWCSMASKPAGSPCASARSRAPMPPSGSSSAPTGPPTPAAAHLSPHPNLTGYQFSHRREAGGSPGAQSAVPGGGPVCRRCAAALGRHL